MKLTVWLCSVEGGNPLRQKTQTPHMKAEFSFIRQQYLTTTTPRSLEKTPASQGISQSFHPGREVCVIPSQTCFGFTGA